MCFWGIFIGGDIDELENEGSSGDDSAAAGKKISADDVFEDGGLARGLRTYNDLEEYELVEGLQKKLRGVYTIWGRSKLSLPIVLKTRSCSLLTMPSKSSPRAAMALMWRLQKLDEAS